MLGPLNQHIGRKLASFIVAFGLACTFQPIPASASNDSKSCHPTVPRDLSPSQFDELRKEVWEKENARDRELSFKPNFNLSDYPFFLMLIAARHIDHGEPTSALFHLEVIDLAPEGANFCQYIFIHEISSSLRYAAINSLLIKDSRNLQNWDGYGYASTRYFSLNDYEKAKCIVMNVEVEALMLDREPNFKEYPRHCVVR